MGQNNMTQDPDMYKAPLIAMSVIACLLFIVLLLIMIRYCRQHRGKTVYKTVNVVPKKVTGMRMQPGMLNTHPLSGKKHDTEPFLIMSQLKGHVNIGILFLCIGNP